MTKQLYVLSNGQVRRQAGFAPRLITPPPPPPPPQAATSLDVGGAGLSPAVTESTSGLFALTASGGNPGDYVYSQQGTWPAWASISSGNLVIADTVPLGGNGTQFTIRVTNNAGALTADFTVTMTVVATGADLLLAEQPVFGEGATLTNAQANFVFPVGPGLYDPSTGYLKLVQKSTGLELPWCMDGNWSTHENGTVKWTAVQAIISSLASTATEENPDYIQVYRAVGARPAQTPITVAELIATNYDVRIRINDVTADPSNPAGTEYVCRLSDCTAIVVSDGTAVQNDSGPSYRGRWERGTRATTFIFVDSPRAGVTPHNTLRVQWEVEVCKAAGGAITGINVWPTLINGWRGDTSSAEAAAVAAGKRNSVLFGHVIETSTNGGSSWATVTNDPVLHPAVDLTTVATGPGRLVSSNPGTFSFTSAHSGKALWQYSGTPVPNIAWLHTPVSGEITFACRQWTYSFTNGGTATLAVGQSIFQGSGDTSTVSDVTLTSGSWAAQTAAGTFTVRMTDDRKYAAGTVSVSSGQSNICTISAYTSKTFPSGTWCLVNFIHASQEFTFPAITLGAWNKAYTPFLFDYATSIRAIPPYTFYSTPSSFSSLLAASQAGGGINAAGFGATGSTSTGNIYGKGPAFDQGRGLSDSPEDDISWRSYNIACLMRPTKSAYDVAVFGGRRQRLGIRPAGRVLTRNNAFVSWAAGSYNVLGVPQDSSTVQPYIQTGGMAFASVHGVAPYVLTGRYWAFENLIANGSFAYVWKNNNSVNTPDRRMATGQAREIAHALGLVGTLKRFFPATAPEGNLGHGITAAEVTQFAQAQATAAKLLYDSEYPSGAANGAPVWRDDANNSFMYDQASASYLMEWYAGTWGTGTNATLAKGYSLDLYNQLITNPGMDFRRIWGGTSDRPYTAVMFDGTIAQTTKALSIAGASSSLATDKVWRLMLLTATLNKTSGNDIIMTLSIPGNPSWAGVSETDPDYWTGRAIWFGTNGSGSSSGSVHARIVAMNSRTEFVIDNTQIRCVAITGGTTYASGQWQMIYLPKADGALITAPSFSKLGLNTQFGEHALSITWLAAQMGESGWTANRDEVAAWCAANGKTAPALMDSMFSN